MHRVTSILKNCVTTKETLHILIIVVIIFILGWLIMHFYVQPVSRKIVDEKINNIISVLEYKYYSDYLKNNQYKSEFNFPSTEANEAVFNGIKGNAKVNESGQVTLKIYSDGYCVTKGYEDYKASIEKVNEKQCLS